MEMYEVVYQVSSDEKLNEISFNMARYFGFKIIGEAWKDIPGLLINLAAENRIPMIQPVIGGADRSLKTFSKNVEVCLKGIQNVMKYLGMLEGDPQPPPSQLLVRKSHFIYNHHGGINLPQMEVRSTVKKGQLISKVVNIYSQELELIKSPIDGVLIALRIYPLIYPGEEYCIVGEVEQLS
jgi:predicted deacylase